MCKGYTVTGSFNLFVQAHACMHACMCLDTLCFVAVSWPLHRHSTAAKCSEPDTGGVYPGVSHAWPCNVQRLDLQELRLQAGRSPGAAQSEPALQDILAAAAPQDLVKSAEGESWIFIHEFLLAHQLLR